MFLNSKVQMQPWMKIVYIVCMDTMGFGGKHYNGTYDGKVA